MQPPERGLDNATALVRLDRRLAALEPVAQVRIGRRLVERLRQLNPQISGLARELAPLVKRRHALLLEIPGCGVITAARLVAAIANVGCFRSDAKLASYAGVAPVDASSGRQLRHRLNRAGNRQLNAALHVIALTQAPIHAAAREYVARRRSDGKTPRKASARSSATSHVISTDYYRHPRPRAPAAPGGLHGAGRTLFDIGATRSAHAPRVC